MLDRERILEFAQELEPQISGELRLDALHQALYATDASMYRIRPYGVLVPRSVEDVQAALETAARHEIPVLPRGSGSSLAGSAVGAALVIDTTRHLDQILAIDPEAKSVTVQPGVVLDRLNRQLAAHGLRVGPDPASSSQATIGGMLGTNATGTHSIRYGSVVDHTREVRALLACGEEVTFRPRDAAAWEAAMRLPGAEGQLHRQLNALLKVHDVAIRRDTPRHWRRAGGYRLERLLDAPEIDRGPGPRWNGTRNLAHLLCGSEGTLAFATEITIGLVARPSHSALGIVHYASRREALEAVPALLGTDPAGVELLDRVALRRAREVAAYAPRMHFVQTGPFGGDPAALLLVEYDGEGPASVRDGLARMRRVLGPGAVVTEVLEATQIADVMTVRKVGLGLAMSARLPVQALAIIEDAAVPVEHLPDYVEQLEHILAELGKEAVVYAHASAGCLHIRPFLDTKQVEGVEALRRIAEASAALVKEYGGTLASEHGDGLARSSLARDFYGDALYAAYQATKRAFDPRGLLNPGKVVEAPRLTEHLRLSPTYQSQDVDSGLTFPEGSFAAVVEACNGQAVCRQRGDIGTMCPPFRITGEEKDSTRGRANALREALSGGLLSLTGEDVGAAMSLCVACKACKAECPASVDIAAAKTVWQEQRWKEERPSLRTRLFSHLPRLAKRAAGPLAPFSNRINALGSVRRQLTRMGVAPERKLPEFSSQPFSEREVASPDEHRPLVVLYADSFARFFEPEIARAAVKVMEAAGFSVIVPPYRCCGRTYLSTGFVSHAKRQVQNLVDTLSSYAEAGLPIVGLEPSCVLTLRDELLRLLPGDERVKTIAARALTFEEWVASERERLSGLAWQHGDACVLIHVHCHQKALSPLGVSRTSLEVAGFQVRETGAGCCGMAGAFGYEAEHYDISMAMADDRLLPTVRASSLETSIVAAGVSCRAQISHGSGRSAEHPAVLLARRLPEAVVRTSTS